MFLSKNRAELRNELRKESYKGKGYSKVLRPPCHRNKVAGAHSSGLGWRDGDINAPPVVIYPMPSDTIDEQLLQASNLQLAALQPVLHEHFQVFRIITTNWITVVEQLQKDIDEVVHAQSIGCEVSEV